MGDGCIGGQIPDEPLHLNSALAGQNIYFSLGFYSTKPNSKSSSFKVAHIYCIHVYSELHRENLHTERAHRIIQPYSIFCPIISGSD